jgi:hypothetical protein
MADTKLKASVSKQATKLSGTTRPTTIRSASGCDAEAAKGFLPAREVNLLVDVSVKSQADQDQPRNARPEYKSS